MDLSPTPDQAAILGALDSLAKPFAATPTDCRDFTLISPALDSALADSGFLDVAFEPDLGLAAAALVVERLARLPYVCEVAATALVRPLLGAHLPRPICLADAGAPTHPLRFLATGATVVVLHADRVTTFTASAEDVRPAETIFAYPMAMLTASKNRAGQSQHHDVPPAALAARWRLALAAELAGLLAAALDLTVAYVTDRQQFGRPIGTFQALRHRLAEAHVRVTASRWLTLKAADSGTQADAALAAHYAQDAASAILYDLHQFLGAMGVTLEHPLHLWTYRAKALLADLGGRYGQARAAADAMAEWND
jgi:hypothetical protein